MAITQIETPQQYHPMRHPVVHIVDSNLKANDEFKYRFELQNFFFANDRVIKVSPRPGDGFGYIDLRRHVRDMINTALFNIKDPDFQQAAFANYTVRIKEEYKDGAGNIVVTTGTTLSSRTGLDLILGRSDYLTFDEADYKLTNSTSRLMWNIENRLRVLKDDIFFIHFAVGSLSQLVRFRITEYFNNGTTNEITITFTANRVTKRTLDLAATLTDPDNTNRIEVFFENSGAVQNSEKKTLLIEDSCSIYRRHKIIYLDSKGSYNSLNFDQVSNDTTTVKPKVFRKFVDATTETDTTRALTRFFVDSEEVFTVNSAILSDKHNEMIRDLIKSTDVYLDVRNDDRFPGEDIDFVPIEILTRNHKSAKSENQELLQKPIQYRYAWEDVTR